jgi:hypothetical protein
MKFDIVCLQHTERISQAYLIFVTKNEFQKFLKTFGFIKSVALMLSCYFTRHCEFYDIMQGHFFSDSIESVT